MKSTYLIICTLITFIFFNGLLSAQNSSKRKYNLSFENYNSEKDKLPSGWFRWGRERVEGEFVDNNFVGKVISTKKDKFGCITYQIPANFIGDSITLSGEIKYENVTGHVGLLMRINGCNSKKSLAFENMGKDKIRGTSDWKRYTIKLPYSINAKIIYLGGIVVGKGTAWFDNFKVMIDGKDIETLEKSKFTLNNYNKDKLNSAISAASTSINISKNDSLNSNLNSLIEKMANKKIVAIGESTHGTSEFYKIREIITKRLIKKYGFNVVVLESAYDDIELLNDELDERSLDSLMSKHLFSIYQTKEMKSFLNWYKINRENQNLVFKGCDDSEWHFYELLKNELTNNNDKKLAKLLKKLKTNISIEINNNYKKEIVTYSKVYDGIKEIESYLKSINGLTKQTEEILFNGLITYVNYKNIRNRKSIQSRDEIMAERISYLLKDKSKKIIIWAHNAHISNEIISGIEIGLMGKKLKNTFGDDYHSIGLTTLSGSYSYIKKKFINGDSNYKDKLFKENILNSDVLLWEKIFSNNGNLFYLDNVKLNKIIDNDWIIGKTKLIGYSKEANDDVYQISFNKIFDSLIFIKNTTATTPLFD